ncbi:MAG TPA: ABC transporter permease [Bacteroides sp.]|nr:ABC transporter permease [Bacteroides sp.]
MSMKRLKKAPGVIIEIIHFARNFPLATIGGIIVLVFVLVAVLAPQVAPQDPDKMNLENALEAPGTEFLLGTDYSGRDMLSRLIFGARISLFISLTSVLIGVGVGVVLGVIAAWFTRLQTLVMRLMDIMLSFPSIIVALTIIAILGSGIQNLIIAIAIYNIPVFARIAFGQTLSIKNFTYIEAVITLGAKDARILLRHILPNIIAPVIVQFTLVIPRAIMLTAGLSFLGLGVMPPTAEWGNMLQNSLRWAYQGPHLVIFPGLALLLVVFGFNTFGDGLRVSLDPRMRNR